MIRTGYSFRHAVGGLEDVIARLKELKWDVAPVADVNSTFAFNRWTKVCKSAGLRPVYGAQLAVTAEIGAPKPATDFWTFLAKDSLRPLHDLIELSTSQPGPAISYEQAMLAPGLIKISGERVLLQHLAPAKNYVKHIPKDFYFGLSPACPRGLVLEAARRKLNFVAMQCNVYPREEDREFYRVTLGRRANAQTYPQHILTNKEWEAAFEGLIKPLELKRALKMRGEILASCKAELQKATLLIPKRPKTLREMCIQGARKLGINLKDNVYGVRLDRELKMIAEKQFEDYFYIIADMVAWAKARMVVGPARGSSCGSLACYLLGITAIDPLPYDLLFERFIDVTRADLPDIDLDFDDRRRHLVFEYAEKKYGHDRVARLGTVGMFKPRSAMKQAGMELRVPQWRIDKVLDSIIIRKSGDSRANQTLEDTLTDTELGRSLKADFPELMIAARMEGHPSVASQHAAGIVLTETPIKDYVAVDARTGSAMCDKKDAEDLNLLKIDALGLTQLSIFSRTLELIGQQQKSGWLEKLPIDDAAAFEVLNKGHFSGIFQYNGGALQSLAKQFDTTCLEDIVAVTALARPGPMASGGASSWVKRKTGQEPIAYAHPCLEPYLKGNMGVVIYQEDVLRIGREIGDLSWEDVTQLRKSMSKSLGKEYFDQWGDRWKAGAAKRGMVGEVADLFWDDLCNYGSWSFNRCLDGDTKIKIAKPGSRTPKGGMKIKDLYKMYEVHPSPWIRQMKRKPILASLFPDKRGWPQAAARITSSGQKVCWAYIFDDGSKVVCTPEHRFLINGRWQKIGAARKGNTFASMMYEKQINANGRGKNHVKGKKYRKPQCGFASGKDNPGWLNGVTLYKRQFKAKMRGKPCKDCSEVKSRMEAHHNDMNEGRDRPRDLTWLCAGCHKKRHYRAGRRAQWGKGMMMTRKKLLSKVKVGLRNTYDIAMPEVHNFALQNGLVTHNSHAVAYGMVSYWCCWLKAHHPQEFAAATLDAEGDPHRQIMILRELKEEGIDYLPVDPEHSTDRWMPVNKGRKKVLVGPLTSIKGIGPATVNLIMEARKTGKPLKPGVLAKLNGCKTAIDSLYPVGDAVKRMDLKALKIVSKPVPVKKVQCGIEDEIMIIGVATKIAPKDENEAINVAKRDGRRLKGPTSALNLFFADDTDEIFAKIDRFEFEHLGRPILENGRAGKTIYAVKGTVPRGFRMIKITAIRRLGDLDGDMTATQRGGTDNKLAAGEQG